MDVQFNEPEYAAGSAVPVSKKSGPLVGFILAQKWAKDDAGAQRILLYVAIVAVAITLMIVVSQFRSSTPPPISIPGDPGVGAP